MKCLWPAMRSAAHLARSEASLTGYGTYSAANLQSFKSAGHTSEVDDIKLELLRDTIVCSRLNTSMNAALVVFEKAVGLTESMQQSREAFMISSHSTSASLPLNSSALAA